MGFYQRLAEYYDEIFPFKGAQKTFLQTYFDQESMTSILDVGCGTGTLALEFAQKERAVHGIDLSPEMIEIARRKARELENSATFSIGDMRDLRSIGQNFDGIVCLGNTLAHVSEENELKQVLAQFRRKAAYALVQTVNYDRILAKHVTELPLIQTPNLTFQRSYSFRSDGRIDFTMKLTFPDAREQVSGVNCLYPVSCSSLIKAFEEEDWEIAGVWGNYERQPWTNDSPATILAARLAK
ncbi:methyltransferase family protein [Desulfosporosinus acidiphilus SJ4]|uniref:Methyltransferase family protein n=1 Tax=Desulfosporosinus acidiphilus (strain DSM 22704 / JCM 16185 / SJ4) TaxID=646529 RepID=I4D802_DESAJ|nr:class I SAM-dependent methyltransferase [Desulfosporosinus acidiphilus]AFM41926.1 methyltransferase family protein [Desulfosporosinus acidiphilus SJ4]